MLLQSSDASKCILLRSTSRAGSLFEFYGSHCNLLVWMELVVLPSCAMESAPKRRTAPRDAFHGRLSTWWLFPTVACFHAIGWRSTCGCKDETCAPIAALPAATRRSVPPSVRPAIAFNPLFLDTFREAIDDLVPSSRSRAVAPVVRARPDVRIQTGAPGRPRRPTVLPRPFPASFPLLFPLRTHAPRRPPPPPRCLAFVRRLTPLSTPPPPSGLPRVNLPGPTGTGGTRRQTDPKSRDEVSFVVCRICSHTSYVARARACARSTPCLEKARKDWLGKVPRARWVEKEKETRKKPCRAPCVQDCSSPSDVSIACSR